MMKKGHFVLVALAALLICIGMFPIPASAQSACSVYVIQQGDVLIVQLGDDMLCSRVSTVMIQGPTGNTITTFQVTLAMPTSVPTLPVQTLVPPQTECEFPITGTSANSAPPALPLMLRTRMERGTNNVVGRIKSNGISGQISSVQTGFDGYVFALWQLPDGWVNGDYVDANGMVFNSSARSPLPLRIDHSASASLIADLFQGAHVIFLDAEPTVVGNIHWRHVQLDPVYSATADLNGEIWIDYGCG